MMDRKPDSMFAKAATAATIAILFAIAWPVTGKFGGDELNAAEPAQTMSTEEFNRRVREYLLNNPEVLAEAMEKLEAKQLAAEQLAAKKAIGERADELLRDPATPVGGNPDGDVTLVEFFDYNCPYCRQVAPTMAKLIEADPKLRVAYKEFPILGANSTYAAKAALAAHRQDSAKYIAFHEALMARKGQVNEKSTLALAAEVGLDVARLKADMTKPEIKTAISRNFELAQALRINGTPGFVIGDRIIPGAADLATLKAAVDQAREKPPGN